MSFLRWGIDLDGVVYEFDKTARHMVREEFGIEVAPWSTYWNHLRDEITPQQWDWLWSEGVRQGLFRHGHVVKGAIDGLKRLNGLGEVSIITHRPRNATLDTIQFLAYHGIEATSVHVLHKQEQKSLVRPLCDLYVDDKPENYEDFKEHCSEAVTLLMARNSNHEWRKENPSEDIIYSWDDIVLAAEKVTLNAYV